MIDPFAAPPALRRAWIRAARWGERNAGWALPIVAVSLSLLWLAREPTEYLYGQDGQSFAQPFAFNHDPLIPYSYDFSQSYPIPFYVTGFYLSSALYILGGITGSTVGSEHLLLFGFAALGALGMWDLLRTAGTRWFGPGAGGPFRRAIAVALYLANPFSISVVWWHIEGWTENYVFLPWLLTALLLVYWEGRLSLARGTIVVLLSLLLADGVAGAFGITIGYLFLLVLVALAVQAIRDRSRLRDLPRAAGTLGLLGVAMLAWTSIPFFLTPNPGYSSNTYVNPQNLDAMFVAQSHFTGPWNTVRMLGFTWLYAAPNAYPWGNSLVILGIGGTLAAFAYAGAVLWVRRFPGFGVLWVGTGGLLLLSFGANPPFGAVDRALLDLHGPFLLLVDPYYLILEPWVITVCLSVFVWLAASPRDGRVEAARFAAWLRAPWGTPGPPVLEPVGAPATSAGPVPSRYSPSLRGVVLLLGLLLVATSVAPVAIHGEYATTGPNVDAFALPPGLSDLASYYAQGYQGAQYEVVALPMSSEVGIPWTVPGGSFLDTSNLLSAYIPYPVLQQNDGALPAALMDWFGSTPSSNYTETLHALHIGSVVVNPYVDPTSPLVEDSPDGRPVNWTHVEAVLNDSLGTPKDLDGFRVYSVAATQPYLWAESNLTTVVAPSLGAYLALLSNVSATDPLGQYLDTALWTPTPVASADVLRLTPLLGPSTTVPLPPNGSARALLSNGTSIGIPSVGAASDGVTVVPAPTPGGPGATVVAGEPPLASSGNASSFSSTYVPDGTVLAAAPGENGTFSFDRTFSGPFLIDAQFNLTLGAGGNWATLDLVSGNTALQAQLYDEGGSDEGTLALSALDGAGVPFAWNNVPVPFSGQPFAVTIRLGPGSMQVQLPGPDGSPGPGATLLFDGSANLSLNPGENLSAAPTTPIGSGPFSVSLSTVYVGIDLSEIAVFEATPVDAIATFTAGTAPTAVPAKISQGITGSWTLTPATTVPAGGPGGVSYVVLDLPQFTAWSLSGAPATTESVSNESNVFAVSGALPSGGAVTIGFSSPQFAGLVASWVEVAAGAAILAGLAVRRWRRR